MSLSLKKFCILETLNLSTCADSSISTKPLPPKKNKKTNPQPASSLTLHIRMAYKEPQIYFFPLADIRPFLSKKCSFPNHDPFFTFM